MLPGVVKTASSYLLHQAGLNNWEMFSKRRRMPVVLGYHRVVEDFSSAAARAIPSLLISTRMFERQLDLLSKQYRFISLDELAQVLENGADFAHPTAAITFDDGYRDVYENALPILMRKGIPAAVFMIADTVGTQKIPIHDQLYCSLGRLYGKSSAVSWTIAQILRNADVPEADIYKILAQSKDPYSTTRSLLVSLPQQKILFLLKSLKATSANSRLKAEASAMKWEMLSDMERKGFTIGSHTVTHAVLANECRDKVARELKGSREILQSRLGARIQYLAYPDGRFDRDTVAEAIAAGYRCAFSTCRHQDPEHPHFTIPRVVLWENSWLDCRSRLSEAIMACQVNGIFDVVARCTQDHRLEPERSRSGFEIQHAEQQS